MNISAAFRTFHFTSFYDTLLSFDPLIIFPMNSVLISAFIKFSGYNLFKWGWKKCYNHSHLYAGVKKSDLIMNLDLSSSSIIEWPSTKTPRKSFSQFFELKLTLISLIGFLSLGSVRRKDLQLRNLFSLTMTISFFLLFASHSSKYTNG